jgi:hypothetical protein
LIGETAPEVTTPAGWQYSGPGSDRSFVEVELLEGECREADWQAAMKTGKFDQFIARQPGHVRQLANSPGYEMNFPGRGRCSSSTMNGRPWIVTSRVPLSIRGMRLLGKDVRHDD